MDAQVLISSKNYSQSEWKHLLDTLQAEMQACIKAENLKRWHEIAPLFSKCYDMYSAKFLKA